MNNQKTPTYGGIQATGAYVLPNQMQASTQQPYLTQSAIPGLQGALQQGPEGMVFKGPQGETMKMVQAWVGISADGTSQPIVVMPEQKKETELSFMVRNIPNRYSPEMLLDEFKCWRQYIDFYYMPIDFKNFGNLGYAFVNFHNVEAAKAFRRQYDGLRLPLFQESNKVLAVSDARVQGQHANAERFRNSSVMGVLQEKYKPMVFDKTGKPMEFPKPDGEIPMAGPRFRRMR